MTALGWGRADTLLQILEPGIYDMPDADYHADPIPGGSLSNTEARRILKAPALYKYWKGRQEHKSEFEFGHAAHLEVLGTGAAITVLDFDNWRTKAAQTAQAEARAAGVSPILAKDYEIVKAMAEALRAHPIANTLLTSEGGRSEQSMFWQDTDPFSGESVWLRGRLDRLPAIPLAGRFIIADYKTAASAESNAFARSAANFGYHCQDAWYVDGVKAILGIDDPAFVFIVQERDAPYLVNVIELDDTARTIGRDRNRRAIAKWIECTKNGSWPGYSEGVELVSLPRWAEIQAEEDAA